MDLLTVHPSMERLHGDPPPGTLPLPSTVIHSSARTACGLGEGLEYTDQGKLGCGGTRSMWLQGSPHPCRVKVPGAACGGRHTPTPVSHLSPTVCKEVQ